MVRRGQRLEAILLSVETELTALRPAPANALGQAVQRWRSDASALRFHLQSPAPSRRIVAILGGTGTGKSTLLNRLLGRPVSAASFRRTFTAGPVAVGGTAGDVLPPMWLDLPHEPASPADLPSRGAPERVVTVAIDHELLRRVTLVDTPDLDGDQPIHHVQADRVFRWAHAIVFVVTPEKYQMSELVAYYRLAARYALPVLHAMNKLDDAGALDDYAARLEQHRPAPGDEPVVFAVPRDDAGFEPPADRGLAALGRAIAELPEMPDQQRLAGLRQRAIDLAGRLSDQVVAPLLEQRREADRLAAAVRAMETPPLGVDVNPITRQLQRRLQQRSILYLIGPQRMLDRVRQVPGLLARLPRTTWDLVRHGRADLGSPEPANGETRTVPDFEAALRDQLAIVQSRIEDVLRSSAVGQRWIDQDAASFAAMRVEAALAGAIAAEELADLRAWLETRWNAAPRDTRLLMKLLRHLPGGDRLTRWSEAAPYLLAIVVATHGAFFGHLDLMILGGYSLATWLSERLSDEVAARTRRTNRRLAERFEQLAHEQILRAVEWIEHQAPPAAAIQRLGRLAEQAAETPPA